MGLIEGAKKIAFNAAMGAAKPIIEKYAGRYVTVNHIVKQDDSFVLSGAIRGGGETIITIGDITIPEDGSTVRIGYATSNIEGVENLINDFVIGREFKIPAKFRSAMKKVKLVL